MPDHVQPAGSSDFERIELFFGVDGQEPRILFPASFNEMLDQAGLEYRTLRTALPAAGPEVPFALEVILGTTAVLATIAGVIKTYIKRHKNRKVVIRNDDGEVILEVYGDRSVEDIKTLLQARLPVRNPDPDADSNTLSTNPDPDELPLGVEPDKLGVDPDKTDDED